jgi:short-subunit dehydrogenase
VRVQAVLPGATRTEIWERSGKDVDAFPAEWVMDVNDLVDAALVGLDRGEEVTIPPLADEALWTAYEDARAAMKGQLSQREPAARYREAVTA